MKTTSPPQGKVVHFASTERPPWKSPMRFHEAFRRGLVAECTRMVVPADKVTADKSSVTCPVCLKLIK